MDLVNMDMVDIVDIFQGGIFSWVNIFQESISFRGQYFSG